MSLASAIATSQTIFSNTGTQTSIVAKNIANVGNPDYVRRLAMMGVDLNGSYYVNIQRAQDDALFKQNITSISEDSAQSRVLEGLELIQSALGGNGYATSPANYLSEFRSSLQTYAAAAGNVTIASSTVADAKDLADSINTASATVQDMRTAADKEIAEQTKDLNTLISQFEVVNSTIGGFLATGKDASDALDQRDKLLKSISEIVGISTVTRENMDTVIYTNDGTMLFETVAREVTFTPTQTFGAAVTGNALYIDNVPVKAGSGGDTTAKGTLPALLQLRDDIGPKMQSQLDEIARGLVTLFAEKDHSATPTRPDLPGLFVWSGSTVPAAGTLVPGIAGSLKINDKALTNPKLIRDGGFNVYPASPAVNVYVSNTTQSAGYSGQLDAFVSSMSDAMTFDVATGLGSSTNIIDYASSSVGWLEQIRKSASTANDNKSAMLGRVEQSLSNQTGVSLDEELALMLDLEQAYKASAKLLSTVGEMLDALMQSVR